jgi:hypothetical protein
MVRLVARCPSPWEGAVGRGDKSVGSIDHDPRVAFEEEADDGMTTLETPRGGAITSCWHRDSDREPSMLETRIGAQRPMACYRQCCRTYFSASAVFKERVLLFKRT